MITSRLHRTTSSTVFVPPSVCRAFINRNVKPPIEISRRLCEWCNDVHRVWETGGELIVWFGFVYLFAVSRSGSDENESDKFVRPIGDSRRRTSNPPRFRLITKKPIAVNQTRKNYVRWPFLAQRRQILAPFPFHYRMQNVELAHICISMGEKVRIRRALWDRW